MFKPSIITSFITNGFLSPEPTRKKSIEDCFQKLYHIFAEHFLGNKNANNFTLPIELYMFMEPDFQYLKKILDQSEQLSLAGFLSKLTKDTDLLDQTFQLLSGRFHELNVAPVAIASFFPEISHTDKNRNSDALGAVAGMQQLAQRFNQEQDYHIRAIELVCGSRIERLDIEEEKDELVSRLIPKENTVRALETFINGLQKTVDDHDPKDVVPYALELEPGSLFLVNSAQSITRIAERLKDNKHIGFNLDLSHFCLAGLLKQYDEGRFQLSSEITNSDYFETFRNRIVHAHISDSSEKGHLGDLPFGSIHDVDYFKNQIHFLANLIPKENHVIPFSTYISMELEAVGRWKEVQSSFRTLCTLCKSV